jgi:small subunit ribosomal protein S14
MAKKSKIAKNEQRRVVVARYAHRRAELKADHRLAGRPRGYLRAFGLSRLNMRRMAHAGELPGVRKSSW